MIKDYDLGDTLKRTSIYADNYFQSDSKVDFLINPTKYGLFDSFAQLPAISADVGYTKSLNFEILGTNAVSTDCARSTTIGGIALTTHGADNDSTILLPHLTSGLSAWTGVKWGTENQVNWETVIRTGTITTALYWAGLKLTNTPTEATDNDQVYFKYDTDIPDTTFIAVYSIADTDVEVDTGVTVVANTNYKFNIKIDSSRKAHFYIDDVEVACSTALTNDVDLIPYIGVKQLAGSITRTLVVVYEKISRIIFE